MSRKNCPKDDDYFIPSDRIPSYPEICEGVTTMSGWSVSILVDASYFDIENTVSGHI